MPAPPVSLSAFGEPLAQLDWAGPAAAIVGGGLIVALAWRLWATQRQYAVELEEQERRFSEERTKADQAARDKAALARESQAKSVMLATLGREVRSHLNGIIGSADVMLDHSLKPAQRENLATLRASAESLNQSLNDVLDYASIETGQLQVGSAPFDLRQPLIEIVETFTPLALLKKLELVLIVAPDVPVAVTGDVARLRQVLFNLMSNAVKFTARGRVVLRVELPPGSAAPTPGSTWLRFSVSDTAPGIPEAEQATLFERPAAPELEASRRFGGSGLELTLSKRLVELMGGQIGVRGLPEGGSEFWVVLALKASRETPPAAFPADGRRHAVVLDALAAARLAAATMLTRLDVDHDVTDTVAKATVLLRDAQEAGAQELALLVEESIARASTAELQRLLAPESPLRRTKIILLSPTPGELASTGYPLPVAAIVRKPLLRAETLLDALRAAPGAEAMRPAGGSQTPFDPSAETRRRPLVLVVDDDAISRSVASQLLERIGCIVELAVSGPDAIDMARRTSFELIFMDCQMPDMDGYTTTTKIRSQAGAKAPPIVALTANTSETDREKCFAAGMCDFVAKPVKKAELARIVQRWAQPAGNGAPGRS